MTIAVAAVSIAARATLDMHSLNNAGSEGNASHTRIVDIVGADDRLHQVNAISGDMLKHIQCRHFFGIARAKGLPLCGGCALLDANRVNADRDWIEQIPATDREAVSALLRYCALDDVAGTLITAGGATGKRAIQRDSVVEFGWALGIPTLGRTKQQFHVKYVRERSKEQARATAVAREQEGSNLGQAIYYHDASSGIYALTCHIELGRIGLNDISLTYAIDEQERTSRAKAVLQSVLYTLLEMNGAMRNTQLPHFVALEGVIARSQRGDIPAPLISPLAGGMDDTKLYIAEMENVARVLSREHESAVECTPFETISDFTVKMDELIEQVVPIQLFQS